MSETNSEWWRGAVIYQIYPRSFYDSNGDGIGDIKGITEKLDHIASLGVDAVWLSPFFKSPMKDYGYDVADYCDVDPMFGSLDDFKAMMIKAHDLGLKIIIDVVFSHSSDQHKWFQESRQSRDNDKADWYVWADPNPDGTPPNNWQSFFGGASWSYEMRRGQYYLHNFVKEQPDLNLRHPKVREELKDVLRFWMDLGIDGFRFDAVMCCFHDENLTDNPVNPNPVSPEFNIDFPTPHTMQAHVNDHIEPPAMAFAEELREVLNEYTGRMSVAEVGGDDGVGLAARFTKGGNRFHTAYNFSLLSGTELSAEKIRDAIERSEAQHDDFWPSWAFSNHDVIRAASRWHPDKEGYNHTPALSKMLIALLCSLRGTPFIYQGEELGLPEASIKFEELHDPWGKYLYPIWQGRDGCRTPMPWRRDQNDTGFGSETPWLPILKEHKELAVDIQEEDLESTLHFTRKFIQWRTAQAALIQGSIEFIDLEDETTLGFIRKTDQEKILCLFNLSNRKCEVTSPMDINADKAFTDSSYSIDGDKTTLKPYGFLISPVS